MNLQAIWHEKVFQNVLLLATAILLFSMGIGWSTPTYAATTIGTEAEVLQIIRKHPEVILESLQAYEEQQREKQEKSRQQILDNVKNNPISYIQGSPATGIVDRKVVLVEFSDFQCPFCAQAHNTLKQFLQGHQDEVTLVYKHFPLSEIHPEATSAAKASWAAGQQGKFWEYHDALFSQQDKLGEQLYLDIANHLNLSMEKFDQDRQGVEVDFAIQKDLELADKLGVQGTPFLFMNGKIFEGAVPLSVLEQSL
ncbi:MAG: disulfide bond formation protein DsbA [Shackletoniella antarctica]|uniref:Disulfide bond formation protein DsbA n=1 Tax=Shackletoniella antarctica TaxID=268115 RepID=A0A2W4WK39_9CYAN|nr:MAG: disulfide bond formation protein DsbA [Shackletoniella antarctica]